MWRTGYACSKLNVARCLPRAACTASCDHYVVVYSSPETRKPAAVGQHAVAPQQTPHRRLPTLRTEARRLIDSAARTVRAGRTQQGGKVAENITPALGLHSQRGRTSYTDTQGLVKNHGHGCRHSVQASARRKNKQRGVRKGGIHIAGTKCTSTLEAAERKNEERLADSPGLGIGGRDTPRGLRMESKTGGGWTPRTG